VIRILNLREDAILVDVKPKLMEKAERMAEAANANTSADVGIVVEDHDDHLLLGPTKAAGLPVEIGHQGVPAKRYFKRAADAERSK
jgi:hypothetical protein